jgi:hypothetical protein
MEYAVSLSCTAYGVFNRKGDFLPRPDLSDAVIRRHARKKQSQLARENGVGALAGGPTIYTWPQPKAAYPGLWVSLITTGTWPLCGESVARTSTEPGGIYTLCP